MKEEKKVEINNEGLNFNIENNPTFYQGALKLENNFFKKINMNRIIEGKKKEIKYLVKQKLGNLGFILNQRKPSPLKFLEKGLQKYLFSKNSDFLVNLPKIRKKYLYEQHKVSNNLNEKIDIGSLVYLQLKDSQSNLLQEKYLKRSSIFKVENSADTIENEYQKIISQKKRNSKINFQKKVEKLIKIKNTNNNSNSNQNIGNSTINSSRNNNNTSRNNYNTSRNYYNIIKDKNLTVNSKQSKRSRNISNLFKLTSYETPKNKKTKSYITTSGNNTQDNSESNKILETYSDKMTKTTHSFLSPIQLNSYNKTIKIHKKIRSNLNEKVSLLNKLTNKCNNQLFKLVDSSKSKEREMSRLKDLEEVFSFKRKKKDPLEENTKNLVYQAKNDVYFGMDKNKAELLTLTDEVTRMPDDVALFFVDRIAKYYENKANLVEEVTSQIGFNPILQKIRNKQNKKLREKIERNFNKIVKLDASLDKKKEEVNCLHEQIFNKG